MKGVTIDRLPLEAHQIYAEKAGINTDFFKKPPSSRVDILSTTSTYTSSLGKITQTDSNRANFSTWASFPPLSQSNSRAFSRGICPQLDDTSLKEKVEQIDVPAKIKTALLKFFTTHEDLRAQSLAIYAERKRMQKS